MEGPEVTQTHTPPHPPPLHGMGPEANFLVSLSLASFIVK